MPSLLDAHIHLGSAGARSSDTPSPGETALRAAPGMAYALQSGISAVRVLGSADFTDVALRNAIEQGLIPGPHILAAGHALSIIGGHGDHYVLPYTLHLEDVYTPLNGFVRSASDAEKAVQLQIKYGARVIKNALDVSKAKVQKLAKTHFPSFQIALKNGVTMAGGSDMGYRPGSETVYDEVIIEVKCGMTPQQALTSATSTAATLIGMERLGRIAPGMEADW